MAVQEQQQRLNEAAEQLTDALVQSYKAVSHRGVVAQERNAQLTEEYFEGAFNTLRTQAEANLQLSEQIANQQQRQVEAAQALTREMVDAYMDFANSVFSFWQGGSTRGAEVEATEAAERKAEEFREVDLKEVEGSGSSRRVLADDVEEAAWGAVATDAAQRKAEELGIDLATVEGTGTSGSITAGDVESAANEEGEKAD